MQTDTTDFDEIDIKVLIQYAVKQEEYAEALAVVTRFSEHAAAEKIFRKYYLELPEGCEEMACDLKVIAENHGTLLCALQTKNHAYLYVGSRDQVQYIGNFDDGLDDEDILLHFGFANAKTFAKKTGSSCGDLPSLSRQKVRPNCVICGAAVGELHVFGCLVEQCPWCDGQLNRCNCRFDQLGVEEIEDEEQLDRFEEILAAKGRIVFKPEQSPSYPIAGDDPGPQKNKRCS